MAITYYILADNHQSMLRKLGNLQFCQFLYLFYLLLVGGGRSEDNAEPILFLTLLCHFWKLNSCSWVCTVSIFTELSHQPLFFTNPTVDFLLILFVIVCIYMCVLLCVHILCACTYACKYPRKTGEGLSSPVAGVRRHL